MFVPLPDLDDRRWTDLVDEGRSLIPILAPEWTDHNEHDPGITLMELFAWMAEGQIYRANRISDSHKRAFLALIGASPRDPEPARTAVEFRLKRDVPATRLPAGVELDARTTQGLVRFTTDAGVWIDHALPAAVQSEHVGGFTDLTDEWRLGKSFEPLGVDPRVGSALYIGFETQPRSSALSLFFSFSGDRSGRVERRRIEAESLRDAAQCLVPRRCAPVMPIDEPPQSAAPLVHHSAALVWEAAADGDWQPLEIDDDTRSLTLDGSITIRGWRRAEKRTVGCVERPLYYVRCRLASGALDAAPRAARLLVNAVGVTQAVQFEDSLSIAGGVVPHGTPPAHGELARIDMEVGGSGEISSLALGSEAAPQMRLIAYTPAQPERAGSIALVAKILGTGNGAPHQAFGIDGQLIGASARVYTLEAGRWRPWHVVPTADAATPADPVCTLADNSTTILFGDGRRGRVPPQNALVFVLGARTSGSAGNVGANKIASLPDTPINRALIRNFDQTVAALASIGNPIPASGGADTETIAQAEARAIADRERTHRAVTAADCEELAIATPGVRIVRAAARPSHHPAHSCFDAPGFVTLVVVPSLPAGRPSPSGGLRRAVASYLNRRRLLGTRILVTAPEYVEVNVTASVRLLTGQDNAAVVAAVVAALGQFLDPLRGGPEGTGWPLGRDVFRSEVLDAIDAVPGVDHVVSLSLALPGCQAQCGNICVPPGALAASGTHRIEAVS